MTKAGLGRLASATPVRKFFTASSETWPGKPFAISSSHRSPLSQALLTALLCLPIFGCQHAMSMSNSDSGGHVVRNEFPLRFKDHNFEAYCYDTIGCSVLYNDFYHVKQEPDEVASPPKMQNYKKYWGGALYIGIDNFPEPAVVKWKSKDGVPHEAQVDIGNIFKDELILHNVPQEEIPVETAATIGGPDVFLEVNDRTINVYMKAMIALKDTATRKSDFRQEVILAWSHTY
ncbi:hypothetical protein [Lysobacter sp. CFH 32150]|uniref:hypothetical protein n=1 Tax=Lysobacter sp. CFH 32150 TaxID=2927128 RepID=UPI001FA6FA16|nr:hypothetical protein [Lysobacter sp. CFH 32150]MCI4567072.1 hypothetical protein [Lysobacter sp. CFH 32150]